MEYEDLTAQCPEDNTNASSLAEQIAALIPTAEEREKLLEEINHYCESKESKEVKQ